MKRGGLILLCSRFHREWLLIRKEKRHYVTDHRQTKLQKSIEKRWLGGSNGGSSSRIFANISKSFRQFLYGNSPVASSTWQVIQVSHTWQVIAIPVHCVKPNEMPRHQNIHKQNFTSSNNGTTTRNTGTGPTRKTIWNLARTVYTFWLWHAIVARSMCLWPTIGRIGLQQSKGDFRHTQLTFWTRMCFQTPDIDVEGLVGLQAAKAQVHTDRQTDRETDKWVDIVLA